MTIAGLQAGAPMATPAHGRSLAARSTSIYPLIGQNPVVNIENVMVIAPTGADVTGVEAHMANVNLRHVRIIGGSKGLNLFTSDTQTPQVYSLEHVSTTGNSTYGLFTRDSSVT